MRNYIVIALLSVMLLSFSSAFAFDHDAKSSNRDFHCTKAWRKDWKADKKEFKIHRKMFQDRPYAAARKQRHAYKKAYKSERREWEHINCCDHHDYWY